MEIKGRLGAAEGAVAEALGTAALLAAARLVAAVAVAVGAAWPELLVGCVLEELLLLAVLLLVLLLLVVAGGVEKTFCRLRMPSIRTTSPASSASEE